MRTMLMMNKIIPASAKDQLFAATSLLVISAILFFGRTLLIPMLLAVLLSFVLTPFVMWLQKKGIHRILSVCIVMLVALVAIGALLLAVYSQVSALILQLPEKKAPIVEKIRFFTGHGPSAFGTLTNFLEDINKNVQDTGTDKTDSKDAKPETPPTKDNPLDDKKPDLKNPVPVTVQPTVSSKLDLASVFLSTQYILGFVTLTIGLCSTILIRREDFRNRLISLIGQGNITSSTRAMEEVNKRISSYLLGQVILNSAFGLLFGIGLLVLNVEFALLWGLLAAVLRFIPGLGTWMAAVIPVVLSLAEPGWWQPLSVLALTAILGVLFNYVIEPIIISKRTGLSIVSLVIMAAFWTWLWGLPGLVLATPVSVCLLVLGSHIPMFHFLYVMLAEGSVLDAPLSFYQRLLANDDDEAASLLENYLLEHTREELCSQVILPALVHAQSDVINNLLTTEEQTRMVELIERLIEQVMPDDETKPAHEEHSPASKVILLGCASHDEREELALSLFGQLMPAEAGKLEIIGDRVTVGEILHQVRKLKPTVICIVSLLPRGLVQPRLRCKRLRAAFPQIPIILAIWGGDENQSKDTSVIDDINVTKITWSMTETMDAVVPLLRVATHQTSADDGAK